ncbi:MAG: histidine kinase [Chloroflexota bacterium]
MNTATNDFWESQLSQTMFNSINVWVNVCDADLNILVWNPTAERISGYSAREVVGNSHCWEWLYPDKSKRTEVQGLSTDLLLHDSALSNITTQILCKDGTYKYIAWYSRPLQNPNSEMRGFVTFGYDVTEQKRSEDALQKAHSELQILYQIASVTSGYTNLGDIFSKCLSHIVTITAGSHVGIYTGNPQTGTLNLTPTTAVPHTLPDVIDADRLDPNNVTELATPSGQACIVIPMLAKGNLQGGIGIVPHTETPLPPDQLTLLRSIADQIAIAIDNANLYQRSKKLAISEERRRLARDLHDSVSQSLYSLTLFAEAGQRMLENKEVERAEKYLERLNDTAQDALREMRQLLFELRPLDLENGKLPDLIQQRLEIVERRSGITAHLITDHLPPLPRKVEENVYYIVLEALNNVLKHSKCSAVSITISSTNNAVHIDIADNGVGFSEAAPTFSRGMGLQNMFERAEEINSTMQISPKADGSAGTLVRIDVALAGGTDHEPGH